MIFTIKIKLIYGILISKDWECIIEVPSDFSLEDLHFIIQDAVGFDDDHMYEFNIANTPRSAPINRFECDDDIQALSISEFIDKSKGKKAFYLFDYGDSWLFQISKSRKKPFHKIVDIKYPRVILETGAKPEQYPNFDE
jgi:hypothetical protein